MTITRSGLLAIRAFGGMSPRMSQYHIPDDAAVESSNCNMLRGVLEPLKVNQHIKRAARNKGLVAYARDKFVTLDRRNDGHVFIGDRVVFTDEDGPSYIDAKTYDDDAATPAKYKFGNLPDLLVEWQVAGADYVPTLTLTGTTGALPYFYAFSVVNKWGDESALSKSGEVGVDSPTNTVVNVAVSDDAITALRTLLDGHELDGMKIRTYRSVASTFLQIEERTLPTAGFNFNDDIDATTEGPSKVNDGLKVKLPETARGFVWHPNGFMACHTDDLVYFSSPLSLSHFPERLRIDPHGGKIVSLQEYGGRLVVLFEDGPPKLIEGAAPGSLRVYSPEIAYRTISGGSVSKSAHGVIYASRDGIVVTDGVNARLIDKMFDANSFERYAPEDIRGYATDLDYYMFGPGRENFLLQRMAMMTHLDETIIDMSQWSDHVYAIVDGNIVEMFGSINNVYREAKWKSKKFQFHQPTLMRAAKMSADYDRFNVETLVGGLGMTEQLGDGSGMAFTVGDISSANIRQEDPARLTVRVIKDDHNFVIENVRTTWPWNLPNRHGSRKSTTFQMEITTNTPVYFVGLAPYIRAFDTVPIPSVSNIASGETNG